MLDKRATAPLFADDDFLESPMKLALIRRQFAATGGAELYLQRLLGALAAAGHEIVLFTQAWDQLPEAIRVKKISADVSRATAPLHFANAVKSELARETFDCIFSLERTLQQDVYRAGDGVHRVWLEKRREFAPWFRKPFVGLGAFHRNMLALEAKTFSPQNTGRLIVNSEMVKHEIIEQFRFPEERIHLVRNGVETNRFRSGKREETRARFGIRDDEFLLLFVGSGWERKGLNYLIEAVRKLDSSKLKLLVVGKGKKPNGAPRNVIFAGPMRDVENAFAAGDLFTFLPIYEPSANVCFEALASGLPVVTSAQNGAGEIIRNGVNGSVVSSPKNLSEIIRAIEFWRNRAGQKPVQTDFDLSLERNVSETVAILELAANEKRA